MADYVTVDNNEIEETKPAKAKTNKETAAELLKTTPVVENVRDVVAAGGTRRYKEQSIIIDGITFTLRYCGKNASLKVLDNSRDRNGNTILSKFLANAMKAVIVSPRGFTPDDLDDLSEDGADTLESAVYDVLNGRFQNID